MLKGKAFYYNQIKGKKKSKTVNSASFKHRYLFRYKHKNHEEQGKEVKVGNTLKFLYL